MVDLNLSVKILHARIQAMDGILPANKPIGISSYDVIRAFKREGSFTGKIGHGGTLDPFAEGVLLILLGKATKRFDEIQSWKKTYLAGVMLGASSTTLDTEGEITKQKKVQPPTEEDITRTVQEFVGSYEQVVPAYSAAKHKGVPMYKLAREGKKVPRRSKKVDIYSLSLQSYEWPSASLKCEVGSGTYVRQLSYDIFKQLGVESYLDSLVRMSVGKIDIKNTCTIDQFQNREWEKYLTAQ